MINKTSIEDAIVTWLYGVTGVTIIIANQSMPRPITPYASINIINFVPNGTAGTELTELPSELIQIDHSINYEIMISINFFKTNAFLNCSIARDSFDDISVIENLEAAGLYYISTSGIREVTDVINKSFEERYQMDVSFYIRSLSSSTVENIRKIEITNELDGSTEIIS